MSTSYQKKLTFNSVQLTFNSNLFQIYQINFPVSEPVNIVLAHIFVTLNIESGRYALDDGGEIVVEELMQEKDMEKWVKMLGCRKKMNEYGVRECIKEEWLSKFDAFTIEEKGRKYIGRAQQMLQPISIIERDKTMSHLRAVVADYHAQNIVLGSISDQHLFWLPNHKQPIFKLSPACQIQVYPEGHLHWIQQNVNPYVKDYQCLANIRQELPAKKNKTINIKQVLKQCQLLYQLYANTNLKSFYQHFLKIQGHNFSPSEHPEWTSSITDLLYRRGHHKQLTNLLSKRIEQVKNSIHLSPLKLVQLEQLLHSLMFHQHKMTSNPGSTASSIIKYLQQHEIQHYKLWFPGVTKEGLQEFIEGTPGRKREELLLWHFLKAKRAGKEGRFYRALAHLKQALKHTQQAPQLAVIALQQGRNYHQLGQSTQALSHYKASLSLFQSHYGSHHPQTLPSRYNIIMLKQQLGQQWEQELKMVQLIQKENGQNKMNMVYKIVGEKMGNKDVLGKITRWRCMGRDRVWDMVCDVVQRKRYQPKMTIETVQQQQQIKSDISVGMGIIMVLNHCLHNPLQPLPHPQIQQWLQYLNHSNLKNYHRLLYLLSLTCQSTNRIQSKQYLNKLLQTAGPQLYPQNVLAELKSRRDNMEQIEELNQEKKETKVESSIQEQQIEGQGRQRQRLLLEGQECGRQQLSGCAIDELIKMTVKALPKYGTRSTHIIQLYTLIADKAAQTDKPQIELPLLFWLASQHLPKYHTITQNHFQRLNHLLYLYLIHQPLTPSPFLSLLPWYSQTSTSLSIIKQQFTKIVTTKAKNQHQQQQLFHKIVHFKIKYHIYITHHTNNKILAVLDSIVDSLEYKQEQL